ncbi:hypothetical protein DYB26_004144 [Aphanomyces astaci]|uniref:Putative auto-transporter adhesin head GIN domain-containing protein n=1 Tax=Aphanomyces astaci TaxID=112090 RepID=A0A397EKZ4_APHAT|nr:hypothetical protein DYB36_002034 [Aphanomyces astaci]RHY84438.1 hypothetical protein DYB31_006800 [Aphanomyces astaci]RHY97744.1 hypothetical protein DYB26_004144 [Aphanomyces astaci]
MVRLFLGALLGGISVLSSSATATGVCSGNQFEVSLLGSASIYCVDEVPCSGNYVDGQDIPNHACPGVGQLSVYGRHQVAAPTCCGIINSTSNVIGCVFQSAKFQCVGPLPPAVPTSSPLPPLAPGAKELNFQPTVLPSTQKSIATLAPTTTLATTDAPPTTATPTTTVTAEPTTVAATTTIEPTTIPVAAAIVASSAPVAIRGGGANPDKQQIGAVVIIPSNSTAPSFTTTSIPRDSIVPVTSTPYPASIPAILEDNITSIVINGPGRVFVSNWTQFLQASSLSSDEGPSEYQVGSVAISGTALNEFLVLNSTVEAASLALLQMYNTTAIDGVLTINFERHNAADVIDGQVLIEIFVKFPVVTSVVVSGLAETFVDRGVLGGADLVLSTGDGNMVAFVNQSAASSIDLRSTGDGTLQVRAASALKTVDSLVSRTNGSGDVVYFVSTLAVRNLTSISSGPGAIHIYASKLDLKNVTSRVSKSGDVVFASGSAMCKYHAVDISGSGSVEAGRVLCVEAMVKVAYTGRGDAVVQASYMISTDVRGPGNVLYYNTTPKVYPTYKKHFFLTQTLKANVSDAKVGVPSPREALEFHLGQPVGNSWLGMLSALNLDRIILYGCIVFVVIAGVVAGSKWYNIYKAQKNARGEYQSLQ